jgi:hypothetical protein
MIKDNELQLLESLYQSTDTGEQLSQRKLAERTGLSLGLINVLLRRFVERGWVKLTHFSRHSLKYVLTPEGIHEVSRRTVEYFSRAVENTAIYRDRIEAFVKKASKSGITTLVLLGPAELDFLFAYSCEKNSIVFYKNPSKNIFEDLLASGASIFICMKEPIPSILPDAAPFILFSDILLNEM